MRKSNYRRKPFLFLVVGVLVFWLVGFKILFFVPLFFIFSVFGMGNCRVHRDDMWDNYGAKRKRKPKRDDVTYV